MEPDFPHGSYAPGLAVRSILFLSQNTALGRGKARKLMAALVRRFSAEVLDVRLFGQNARLYLHNNSSEVKALMNPRRYARRELDFCALNLPAKDGVFIDIGANAGLFSLGVLEHMSGGTVIAAEPQPTLYKRLTANLKTFNSSHANRPDLHILQTAIGTHDGELSLSVPDQLGQASARPLVGARTIQVPVQPLLGIIKRSNVLQIDVLKIDIEGFEDEVILPFLETAPETLWPNAIVIEHCHRDRWKRDCEAGLLKAGYRLADKDRTNLMFARRAA